MSTQVENTITFLSGLSSFWTRIFKDKETLSQLYQASESLVGQAYLDLLEAVLGPSLELAPIYHKENWQLLLLSTDMLSYDATSTAPFIFNLPDSIVNFRFLNNQILNPSVVLENKFDFELDQIVDPISGQTATNRLKFFQNPFTSGTNGNPINGVPYKQVNITTVTHQKGTDGKSGVDPLILSVTANEFRSTSATFSVVDIGRSLILIFPTGIQTYKVSTVLDSNSIQVVNASDNSIPVLPSRTAVSWQLQSQSPVTQIAFWIPNAQIDNSLIQLNFGFLVNRIEPSSLNYRALIEGIFQYFLLGPALERIEAALNVITGVPVAAVDGELLISAQSNFTSTQDRIVTNQNTYLLPAGSTRLDILDSANWNILTFKAFEPFSTIFDVVDYIKDDTWFWNILIPQQLLPTESDSRRTVSPQLYELIYGQPQTQSEYGDLGLYYGSDDSGIVVPSSMARTGLYHNFAYQVMDKFIKNNMFGVFIQNGFNLPRTQEDLIEIILQGKPSYTFSFFEPEAQLVDQFTLTDTIENITVTAMLTDSIPDLDTSIKAGSPLAVNSYYFYSGSNTTITIATGTPDPTMGQTPCVVGGTDPSIPQSLTVGFCDWPVALTVS